MASDYKDRATQNVRARHVAKIREMAEDAQSQAQYILADLDRDRVPRIRNLLEDAQQIFARIQALETADELAEIYRQED